MSHPRRLQSAALAVYAALGAAWAALARRAVPPVIAAAYEGRSLPVLNRILDRPGRHPLAHYLGLWDDLAGAVLIAGALHLVVVLVVLRRVGGRAGFVLIVFGAAFLSLAVLSGARHDYVADLEIWNVVLRGGDPWWIYGDRNAPLNAYGPLFNALAPLIRVNPLLPKLLFAAGYVVFVVALLGRFAPRGGRMGFPWPVLAAWVVNPLPWVEVAYFGHWDIVLALACVAAVHARRQGRDARAGAWLALGVLLKYLPVVLVPFLAVEGGRWRVRPRLLVAMVGLTALGFGASVLAWGTATFRPITFAATRGSNLLSVFRFLRGAWSPLRALGLTPNADALALPCMAAAGLAVFAWCWRRRVEPATSAVLAVLTTLLFYQVGFVQYQIVLFLLASYWYAVRGRDVEDAWLRAALAAYFGWLALFDVCYAAIGGVIHTEDRWAWVEDAAGLPTFLLGAALLAALLRASASPALRTTDD